MKSRVCLIYGLHALQIAPHFLETRHLDDLFGGKPWALYIFCAVRSFLIFRRFLLFGIFLILAILVLFELIHHLHFQVFRLAFLMIPIRGFHSLPKRKFPFLRLLGFSKSLDFL